MPALGTLLVVAVVVVTGVGCSEDDDSSCPEGTKQHSVCTECGPAGGCGKQADKCAKTCAENADCDDGDPGLACFDGVCQVGYCD